MKNKIIEILKEYLVEGYEYPNDDNKDHLRNYALINEHEINIVASRIEALLPTEEEIDKAAEDHNRRSYCGHFDGDEPSLHWMAGAEFVLSKIKTK